MAVRLRKALGRGMFLQHLGLVVLMLALGITLQFVHDDFFTSANLEVLAMNRVFEGIMALGMTFIIISGGIDLSVSSVFPFAEIIVAKLMMQAGLPILPAVIITLLLCLAVGAVNGLLINILRVYPMVITMSMMLTLRGVNLAITNGHSIAGFSDTFLLLGQGKVLGVNVPIIFFLVAALVLGYLLRNHRYFRQLYFIGGGERAARLSGVNVAQVKVVIYMLSSFLAGCAGIMGAAQYGAAHWGHGNMSELQAIAAVAIGGANINGGSGVIGGTVLGILFLAVVHNAFVLSGINTFFYDVANGLMLILAVLFSWYIERKNAKGMLAVKQRKLEQTAHGADGKAAAFERA